jgi:hypothetical protein
MKLYAEVGALRARQVALDAAVVAWTVLWIWAGVRVHDLVARLAAPAQAISHAGADLARPLRGASRALEGVPVVGEALRGPLDAAAEAGVLLQQAGASQGDVVRRLALWLGVILAAIPVSLLLLRYVPARVRWVRTATAAHALRRASADLELFALRAVAMRPLHELRRAHPDPAGALAARDFESLAALELESLGLRVDDLRTRGRGADSSSSFRRGRAG